MWPFRRAKPAPEQKGLTQPADRGWYTIFESFAGAWQQEVKIDQNKVLANHAIFACVSLISCDISKLRPRIIAEDNGIWVETKPKGLAVVQKPNAFQNRIQFYENWIISKLLRGNTYVLKERARSGGISALYILCPDLVKVLVSDSGRYFTSFPATISQIFRKTSSYRRARSFTTALTVCFIRSLACRRFSPAALPPAESEYPE